MPGKCVSYVPTRLLCDVLYVPTGAAMPGTDLMHSAIGLHTWYAMPGTDVRNGARAIRPTVDP
eukprot:3470763-Rhodomonas_salina.5